MLLLPLLSVSFFRCVDNDATRVVQGLSIHFSCCRNKERYATSVSSKFSFVFLTSIFLKSLLITTFVSIICALSGEVFGSFTATPWHRTHSYFGTGEAFLWKMTCNRMTPCHSLLDQAQMESEVDIYPFSGLNYYIQLCTDDKLAVGGGKLIPDESLEDANYDTGFDILPVKALERLTKVVSDKDFGFGIAINGDLSFGTSSACATFRNPSLTGHSSEAQVFEVLNLEIWAFTPCKSVHEAEHLEITKSWRAESFRETGSWTSSSIRLLDSKKQGVSSVLERDSLQQLWQM